MGLRFVIDLYIGLYYQLLLFGIQCFIIFFSEIWFVRLFCFEKGKLFQFSYVDIVISQMLVFVKFLVY